MGIMDELEKSSAAAQYMGGAGLRMGQATRAYKPSQAEMLREKKAALEAELVRVNAALAALEEHPEIERVMTLVSQALY